MSRIYKEITENVFFLICFERISQSSEGLKKKLRCNNEAECLNKVYFPKSFSSNTLFVKLDECPYIFLCRKEKKKVEIYHIFRMEQGFFETKGLATKPLKVVWRLGLSVAL